MTVSPETLLAFVEGELSPEEARRVAAEVANDPRLAAHVENHKVLKARLQAASLPIGGDAQPGGTSAKTSVEGAPIRRPAGWISAATMAAGIALGALLAVSLRPGSEIRGSDGQAVADGGLARALSTVIGAEQTATSGGAAHIGESFFSSDGYFCRDFITATAGRGALSGIACREGDAWRIRVLASAEPGDPEKTDAPSLPGTVRDLRDVLRVGQPLDADGERAARAQNWLVR